MMKRTFGSDQTITSYLLNELSEEDQELFEEAYLSDPSLFEQVQALEEELIEDYVKGDLSGQERRRFELHYLASDQRRARIEAARELLRVCSLKAAAQNAADAPAQTDGDDRIKGKFFSLRSRLRSLVWLRPAPIFGVAVALLSLLCAGFGIELLRLRGQLAAVSEERAAIGRRAEESERRLVQELEQLADERKRGVELREELENLNSQSGRLGREQAEPHASKNQVVSLALTPSVRNIENPNKAVLSAHTSLVVLRVELERQETANLRSCRAVVKTVEGDREIWRQEGIKPPRRKSAQGVVVKVPADRFRAAGAQDFILTLDAPTAGGKNYEELEKYYFQVTTNRH
jgi:anti-sigma-K factor RskA